MSLFSKHIFCMMLMLCFMDRVAALDTGPGSEENELEELIEPGQIEGEPGESLHNIEQNLQYLAHYDSLSDDQVAALKAIQVQMDQLILSHETPGRKCMRWSNDCLNGCLPSCSSKRPKKWRSLSAGEAVGDAPVALSPWVNVRRLSSQAQGPLSVPSSPISSQRDPRPSPVRPQRWKVTYRNDDDDSGEKKNDA